MALFPSAFGEYYGFTAFTTEHTKLTENAQIRLPSLNYTATITNHRGTELTEYAQRLSSRFENLSLNY